MLTEAAEAGNYTSGQHLMPFHINYLSYYSTLITIIVSLLCFHIDLVQFFSYNLSIVVYFI